MTTRVRLLVGTKKGAFILDSDEARRDWSVSGPLCEGWPVHDLIVEPGSGAILAAAGNPWYGPAIWRSEDGGSTWTHSSAGLTYGDGAEPIATVWSLATTPDGGILAGVEPAGLFRSDDRGATWRHVEGLTEHPSRPTWGPGAGGLILHTIVPHPTDTDRTWVGISAVGVSRRVTAARPGRRATSACAPSSTRRTASRRPASASTSSRMAAGEPETLYQRNHCGVYRSDDGSETWQEITGDLPSDFGFSMVAHPRDPDTCWIIPLSPPTRVATCPTRTPRSGGRTIAAHRGSALTRGCRRMTRISRCCAKPWPATPSIRSGSPSARARASCWHSSDEGETWRMITDTLPEIWGVEAVVLEA